MSYLAKTIASALVVGVLGVSLPACQKQEGPLERAGKEVDQAVKKAGQKIEEAGENIQDAAKNDKK